MRTTIGGFILVVCSHGLAQQSIGPGTRVNVTLASGESRFWEIPLKKNDYLHAVILQKGIDVAVRVLGQGSKKLTKIEVEIDALSDVAMLKGARAVLASLWPVNDESTAAFMCEFYRGRQQENLTKSEALRRAQAAMIHGELRPGSYPSQARGVKGLEKPAPRNYSHPHYWAPFILIGNMQ